MALKHIISTTYTKHQILRHLWSKIRFHDEHRHSGSINRSDFTKNPYSVSVCHPLFSRPKYMQPDNTANSKARISIHALNKPQPKGIKYKMHDNAPICRQDSSKDCLILS